MEASDSALHVFGEKNVYFKDEIRPKQDFDFDAIDCYKTAMGSSGAFGNKKYG